jgi:murein DD-endopeptidase MepM/ murein hydrolase activator NlpD
VAEASCSRAYHTALAGVILGCAALLLPSLPLAAAPCSEGWLCVEAVDDGEDVRLVARNLQPYPVTLTVDAHTRNLQSEPTLPVTLTLGGEASVTVARLFRHDPRADYHYRYWFDWAIGDRHARHDDGFVYRLPFATGARFLALQGFGARFSHTGLEEYAVDFAMPEGTPVHAARDGRVVRVIEHNTRGCWKDGCGRYANFIVILHADGTTGEYFHLRHEGALVEPGDRVEQGQLIGLSGNTGHTTMPHLHFAVYRPVAWGKTQSLPIRFRTRRGIETKMQSGQYYTAP